MIIGFLLLPLVSSSFGIPSSLILSEKLLIESSRYVSSVETSPIITDATRVLTVNVNTPNKNKTTKKYFVNNPPPPLFLFLLLGLLQLEVLVGVELLLPFLFDIFCVNTADVI